MSAEFRKMPGLFDWLAGGERGVSSDSIVQHLTGIPAARGWGIDIPHDPSDFDRCLQLLEAVPALRLMLPEMATASPMWAALIERWAEIEACHLDEVGLRWTKGKSAPKTYEIMRSVIDGARAKATKEQP